MSDTIEMIFIAALLIVSCFVVKDCSNRNRCLEEVKSMECMK